MFNILTDKLVRFKRDDNSITEASLPEVYAALMSDEVASFPALRPHQRHAWHAFLVQLGVIAMHNAGCDEPPEDVDTWRRIIRELTPAFPDDEPWHLIVDDITKPAFMQPPASSEDRCADYKSAVATPDELDMLVTSKNHDVKASVASSGDTDDWIFALITLQTTEGFGGARNYGVSRMPSGYGNRPAFSLTPSILFGSHVSRDIQVLLKSREQILDDYDPFLTGDGIALVWLETWDGTKSEAITGGLDPFYIEICRRIRLSRSERRLAAIRANSLFKRIIDVKGMTGDPWAPENTTAKGTPTAFLGPRKFGYERIVEGLVSPDWKQPYLLKPTGQESSEEMYLVARGLIRGEGRTSGYHERIIRLNQTTVRAFGNADAQKRLGDIARERIEQIGKVKSVLRHAIATFAAHGDSNDIKTEHWSRANPWSNKLDEIVDATFFDDLQDEFEAGESERDEIRKEWLLNGLTHDFQIAANGDGVCNHAQRLLRQAQHSLPCPAIQRYRARVRADSVFEGSIRGRNGLPFVFAANNEEKEA